ncbi:MAG: hydroxymethylglutaryl-CoA synthase [Chloroflexi bacterium]|nr:MAG: hydroxymethylglutaryl-CoA synthase [Chloroflexota bacterium]
MVGIVSYGAYIPIYRLSRDTLSAVWGKSLGRGERAVANADEDSITMAVEAVVDCLTDLDRQGVDALYFATTTPPYKDKQSASIIRAATDLREDASTMDFGHSLRSCTNALTAASNAIKAGEARRVMVAASECRVPAPNSEFEPVYGDGAAAFLLGDSDVAASIEGSYTISSEFIDVWRKETDTYAWAWEDRFTRDEGYEKILPQAIRALMQKYNLAPKDFTKAIFYAPDARSHTAIARKIGLDPNTQVQQPLFDSVGDTGCAFAPMMLVAALEEARPGDRLLFASYGDGVDAYVLQVTEEIEKTRNRRGIRRHLASKMDLSNYGVYLQMRNMMEWAPSLRPTRRSALSFVWRDRKMFYGLYGQKCRSCGHIQYPKQRLCIYCQARDNFDEIRLSDKKGKLFTYSIDERAREIILPMVRGVIDLEGGGRYYSSLTDRDPEKIDVGIDMELTFRLVFDGVKEGSGFRNYTWKARPVRC